MELIQAINERRSIRTYIDKMVDKELITKIIEDAIKAPSACNRQPWKFIVLDDNLKDKITAIAKGNNSIKEASTLVMVYSDADTSSLMDMISVGACIENMLLSATSYGLGTLWVGSLVAYEKEINELLNIKDLHLISGITIGYKNESPEARPRKEINEVLEWI